MKLVRMRALKPTRYRTRRLLAGAEFDATPNSARLFTKLRRAEPLAIAAQPAPIAAPVVAAAADPVPGSGHGSSFLDLCEEYERLAGAAPDRRWGEARLAKEISLLNENALAGRAANALSDGSPAFGDGE